MIEKGATREGLSACLKKLAVLPSCVGLSLVQFHQTLLARDAQGHSTVAYWFVLFSHEKAIDENNVA